MTALLSINGTRVHVPNHFLPPLGNGDNGAHSSPAEPVAAPSGNGDNGPGPDRAPEPSPNGEPCQPSDPLTQPPALEDPNPVLIPLVTPSGNGDNGRDSQGRFTRGNRGGPGNPFARRTAALRRAFCTVMTEADAETLARRLLERALNGDLAAAKVVLAYAIGKPTMPVDPDTLDIQEWNLFQQGISDSQQFKMAVNSLPAEVGCLIMRVVAPQQAEDFGRMCQESLDADARAAEEASRPRKKRSQPGKRSQETVREQPSS